jgi:ubiquinone/menaquinone biosynthesis C-methylase UbiE
MSQQNQKMTNINPIDVLFWTLRRDETDVINLYDALALLMQISTGSNMLNFGYWDANATSPLEAQTALCKMIANMSELQTAKSVLDVGSGFSEPAHIWKSSFPQIEISCVNVNQKQLDSASNILKNFKISGRPDISASIHLVNSTATRLPFADKTMDRVVVLESSQHFKPFSWFASESKRVLKDKGILTLAMPVMTHPTRSELFKLGILSFTWSSEHYHLDKIKETMETYGLKIKSVNLIGQSVYEPLADYYMNNKESLRRKILQHYPSYIEKILAKSLLKMKQVSEKGIIDYVLLKCVSE